MTDLLGAARQGSRIAILLAAGVTACLVNPAWGQTATNPDTALSDLLKLQTQAFSEAGQVGDLATMAKYLDPDVVFMNETGSIASRKDLVGDGPPPPFTKAPDRSIPDRTIKVTEWALRPQGHGQTATATFVDVVTVQFHGQTLVYKYRSTETWAKRADGWKMIASQTMNVVQDPVAASLPAADLDAYVGTYEVDPSYKVEIRRDGDGLVALTNGGTPLALKAELRDVLFVPGVPNARRIFQRDVAGHVTGYISRRDGTDAVLRKIA
jgi:ketosteroid isomerase-like protein